MITKRDEQREGRRAMSGGRSPALVVRTPGDVVLEERDAPVPGPGEVLIRPDVVGLCGTDLDLVAGALVEPASVVYRALAGSAVAPGCRALVVGDGTVALLAVRLLGLWSPGEIVMLGRREGQARLAATAGAARFETSPEAAGTGYDLVIEAAGTTDAVLTALAAARRGGSVVLIGLPPHGETAAVPVD